MSDLVELVREVWRAVWFLVGEAIGAFFARPVSEG